MSALRNFALTFVLSAVIFGLLAYFIVGFVLDTLSVTISAEIPEDTLELIPVESTEPPEETTAPPEDEDPVTGDTFNILLIGTDYQPDKFSDYDYEETYKGIGFPDKRSRPWGADMLVLVRVDKENRKFVFCAIPRNTRVMVDGNYIQLGDVCRTKGAEFLCGKVTGLIGLEIDYFAELDVGGIAGLVDIFGSITYYVPEDMDYEDPEQGLAIHLKKGTHAINGEKAAQLLRYAGYTNGDKGRMQTAISYLQGMLAKFTNVTYLTKIPKLYEKAAEMVNTNFTADDLANNLDLIFAYSKFEAVTVNYPGSTRVIDGITYFEPSLSNALEIFEDYK